MIHNYRGIEPMIGSEVFMSEGTHIIGNVTIGDQANIWFGTVLRGDVNSISIGRGTNIQDNSTVHLTAQWPTVIGEYVTVGHNCIIHACTIENHCLIGMGSTILDGAVIGEGSIVGANSLVTMNKKFPPNSLIIGSPAKVIRPITEDERQQIKDSAVHYIDYAAIFMEDQLLR